MNDEITHPNDGAPRNVGMCRLEIIIHGSNRFSYDSKPMERCLGLVNIIQKVILGQPVYTTAYRDRLLQNVVYPLNILVDVFFHTDTISFLAL